jgi:ATP-binding cassette subfamily F protein uup
MRLLMSGPNVLVLDEPTNDLDVEVLASLEDLLDSFAGTVVVVSHDRYFLERVCTTFRAVWGDGAVTDLPGGIDQYLTDLQLRWPERVFHVLATAERAGAVASGPSGGERHALTKRAASLERRIATAEARIVDIHNAMGEHATDPDTLLALGRDLREQEAVRAALEHEWFEVAEQLG